MPGREITGGGESDADADAGPRVPAVEHVVLALAATREAADPTGLPKRLEAIQTTGQELMGIRLVPRVPHDPVARRIHDAVQRERDLHGAQRAGEMTAGVLDGANHLLAQLGRELFESRVVERAQLRGVVNGFEKGHRWSSWIGPRPSIARCRPPPIRTIRLGRASPSAQASYPSKLISRVPPKPCRVALPTRVLRRPCARAR